MRNAFAPVQHDLRVARVVSPQGSWAATYAFRCSLLYLLLSGSLWIFEFADKSTAWLAKPFLAVWRPVTLGMASYAFHWYGALALNFVRDTRYLYALCASFLLFSLLAAAIWTALGRNRAESELLHHGLRIFLRYVLAYLLLHYGMDKLFLLQFPSPGLARLTERLGDYSPSSLMWAFIGSSPTYTVFGGLAEILSALLLLFRRTALLGALIAFAVMCNVAVMDFSYDVSVKLLSLHILLMAGFLVLPDLRRLLAFFLLNKATEPSPANPMPLSGSQRKMATLLKVGIILYLIVPLAARDWRTYRQTGQGAPKPPFYGLYQVGSLHWNGAQRPPLETDPSRWRYIIFDAPGMLTIERMDHSLTEYSIRYDAGRQTIMQVAPSGSTSPDNSLHLLLSGPGALQLGGQWEGVPVEATLTRIDRESFTLVSRGFHWISETSFIH